MNSLQVFFFCVCTLVDDFGFHNMATSIKAVYDGSLVQHFGRMARGETQRKEMSGHKVIKLHTCNNITILLVLKVI